MKNGFVLYYDLDEVFGFLTDREAGALIKAVFAYEIRGETTQFKDRMLASTYKRITDNLDRNKIRYEETCQKRREAAQKRWETSDGSDSPQQEAYTV